MDELDRKRLAELSMRDDERERERAVRRDFRDARRAAYQRYRDELDAIRDAELALWARDDRKKYRSSWWRRLWDAIDG